MSAFQHHMRFWAIWMLSVSALLMVNPGWDFGWVELAAAFSPLVMAIDRRIWREPALAIGLPTITLLWLADPAQATIPRLLLGWGVFASGVVLAARTIDTQREIEAIAGAVACLPSDRESIDAFHKALAREIGRARRHEKTFVVLSIGVGPAAVPSATPHPVPDELWRSIAENRARLELGDLVRTELHVYSDVTIEGDRILALVPEIGPSATDALGERLRKAARARLGSDIRLGIGRFPHDAVSATDLISAADEDRKTDNLVPLPTGRIGRPPAGSDESTSDVQG
ncbi:MAG TPA: hypothetical protein ENI85_13565 [Deltaproteobacteria bacterium]|nr:hypothetical protein [Deltaproteobacteria bacterium]